MDRPKKTGFLPVQHNNLRHINGIGPGYATVLHKSGLEHISDLIHFTPETLSAHLRQKANAKISVKRIQSQDWIGQARKLVLLVEEQVAAPQLAVVLEKRPYAEGTPAGVSNETPPHKKPPHAEFSLFFDHFVSASGEHIWQTRLYHAESGEEALLEGTEAAVWTHWIEERADLPPTPLSDEDNTVNTVTTPQMSKTLDLNLQIVEIAVLAGATADTSDVTVHFALYGRDAPQVSGQRNPYQIELLAINLETNTILQCVESGILHLIPGKSEYRIRGNLPLPATNSCELQAVVYFHAPAETIAYRSSLMA